MSAPRRLARGDRLVLASHNPGKLAEIEALLAPHGIIATAAAALGLAAPAEDAPDFAGNAAIKALAAGRAAGLPALSDDSGFCVAALDGAPGVHSARWAVAGDFGGAMQRVHDQMGAAADRRAWFVCALCIAWPDGVSRLFEGRVDGTAIWPPRGAGGFGYDAMFVPAGAALSYAEMEPAQKRADSHRARAFTALLRDGVG